MLDFKFSTPAKSLFQPPEDLVKTELEAGIDIDQSIIKKLQSLWAYIIKEKEHEDVIWLSKENNLVFRLRTVNMYVFKTLKPNWCYAEINICLSLRINNMVKALRVCKEYGLNLLVIPHAKEFTLYSAKKCYSVIAEESLDLNGDSKIQQKYYTEYAPQLNETIKQLAIFILKTGFYDIKYDNIPILNQPYGSDRRIGLVDLEHMGHTPQKVITAINQLLFCIKEEQQQLVINVAGSVGVSTIWDTKEFTLFRVV
jgi:hypothetical protein